MRNFEGRLVSGVTCRTRLAIVSDFFWENNDWEIIF